MAITLKDLEQFRRQVDATRKQLQEEEITLRVLERMYRNSQQHGFQHFVRSLNGVDLFSDENVQEAAVPDDAEKAYFSAPDDDSVFTSKSSLKELVFAASRLIEPGKEFTVEDIEVTLKRKQRPVAGKAPRARIAMALQKLRNEGLIERTYEGSGSIPHRFKVSDSM